MRVKLNKILFMFIFITFIMTMTSCNKEVIDYSNGISMDEDTIEDYKAETYTLATETISGIYDVLNSKFDGTTAKIITKNKAFFVDQMKEVFIVTAIPEDEFQDFLHKLNGEQEAVANILYIAMTSKLDKENIEYVNDLYNTIIDTYGSKYVDGIFYGFINCYYEFNIFTNQDYIETYSNNPTLVKRYQKKLDEIKADQEVFKSIDKKSFSSIIKAYIIFRALSGSSNDAVNSLFAFSNKEIEKIVKNFQMECELTTIQWMTLFKLMTFDNTISKCYDAVVACGDEEIIGNILNQLFVVLNSVKDDITAEFIGELRSTKDYFTCIYSYLSQNTLDELEKLSNMKLYNVEYQNLIASDATLSDFFNCENKTMEDLTLTCDYELVLRGLLRGMLYE